jgi:hypothetical protein
MRHYDVAPPAIHDTLNRTTTARAPNSDGIINWVRCSCYTFLNLVHRYTSCSCMALSWYCLYYITVLKWLRCMFSCCCRDFLILLPVPVHTCYWWSFLVIGTPGGLLSALNRVTDFSGKVNCKGRCWCNFPPESALSDTSCFLPVIDVVS